MQVCSAKSQAHEDRSPKATHLSKRVSVESVDVCAARLFTISLLVVLLFSANLIVVHAQPETASAERALFDAANRERTAQGLPTLRWDDSLANAARNHALLMAQRNTLSHQFPGEAALQDRARLGGARFTEIAENVAEGPTAEVIHSSWMHSPPHRANLLDPELTAIGIAVVATSPRDASGFGGNGMLFAVEDFSQSVANLDVVEQEKEVSAALASRGLQVVNFGAGASNGGANLAPTRAPSASGTMTNATETTVFGAGGIGGVADARRTCEMERGWSGARPSLVVRYESGDLSRLPNDLERAIQSGRYRAAAVGACEASGSSRGFTHFRVAVLLY